MQTPNHDGLLTERQAAIESRTSILVVRVEVRNGRLKPAVRRNTGGMLFDPGEVGRFKRKVVPIIQQEQRQRIRSGSLKALRRGAGGRNQLDSSGDSGDEDPARP